MDWKSLVNFGESAIEEIGTAEILIEKRRFSQGIFFAHLALEKAEVTRHRTHPVGSAAES